MDTLAGILTVNVSIAVNLIVNNLDAMIAAILVVILIRDQSVVQRQPQRDVQTAMVQEGIQEFNKVTNPTQS